MTNYLILIILMKTEIFKYQFFFIITHIYKIYNILYNILSIICFYSLFYFKFKPYNILGVYKNGTIKIKRNPRKKESK